MSDFEPGDGVVYRPHPDAPAEDGTVTSVNDRFAFVQFVGDRHSKAVLPDHLERLRADS